MNSNFFEGLVAPMLTPFNEDKSIDKNTLSIFTEWLCTKNVDILFPMGGSGEYKFLETEERKQIIDIVVSASDKKVPVVPGIGGKSIEESLLLAHYAQDHGADGISVVVPGFIDPDEDSIYQYYEKISSGVEIPIMIYDPRGSGDYAITPNLLDRMVTNFSNVKAIKYRTADGELMAMMLKKVGSKISVLSGVEFVFLSDLAIGVKGLTGGGVNIFPELLKEIQNEFNRGNIDKAREAFFKVLDYNDVLNLVSWPLGGKIALNAMGVPFKPITRQEIDDFSVESSEKIANFFKKI